MFVYGYMYASLNFYFIYNISNLNTSLYNCTLYIYAFITYIQYKI